MTLVKHSKRTVRKGCKRCARLDLYWAHDTDEPSGQTHCESCGTAGRFVLIEANGTPHSSVCSGQRRDYQAPKPHNQPFSLWDDYAYPNSQTLAELKAGRKIQAIKEYRAQTGLDLHAAKNYIDAVERGEIEPPQDNAKEEPVPAQTVAKSNDEDVLAALRRALSPEIDRQDVINIVKEEMQHVAFPTVTVVVKDDQQPKKIDGATHAKLGDVLTDLAAGEHVLMVGPAGTGKSTIAEQAAEALSLEFGAISLSPMTPASQILGYMQAEGAYVRTIYRERYENGGLFHFDEFDNAHPSVLAVINASLANGHMAFPDAMVPRHESFRVVASANTYGRGPDRQYVGRQQVDAATLDRFAVETIDIDESLERQLCLNTGLESSKVNEVLAYVRYLRKQADKHKLTVVVSPRASVGMCRLLKAGRTWSQAVEARARRGLSDVDWTKLSSGAPSGA